MKKSILVSLLSVFAIGICAQSVNQTTLRYIETYRQIAIEQEQEHSIPAAITLAQGILESASGTSTLAKEANNHFGIKCHGDWTGETFFKDDDKKNECFRSYPSAEESFEDHSHFLKKKRYADLFKLDITDYKGWAKGLKQAGYATNPDYPKLLIDIIELYGLDKLDSTSTLLAQRQNAEGKPSKDWQPNQASELSDKVSENQNPDIAPQNKKRISLAEFLQRKSRKHSSQNGDSQSPKRLSLKEKLSKRK